MGFIPLNYISNFINLIIMHFVHNDVSPHPEFSNGCNGTRSGGSMNNPMYQKICALGTYEPQSGRSKQRNRLKRVYGISSHKNKQFWDL
tara:strand:- start:545 stop:811 length:267 start_codon:yes stop_codon:yes gene_type:complete